MNMIDYTKYYENYEKKPSDIDVQHYIQQFIIFCQMRHIPITDFSEAEDRYKLQRRLSHLEDTKVEEKELHEFVQYCMKQ